MILAIPVYKLKNKRKRKKEKKEKQISKQIQARPNKLHLRDDNGCNSLLSNRNHDVFLKHNAQSCCEGSKGDFGHSFQIKQLLFTFTIYLNNINCNHWILIAVTSKELYKTKYIPTLICFPKILFKSVFKKQKHFLKLSIIVYKLQSLFPLRLILPLSFSNTIKSLHCR